MDTTLKSGRPLVLVTDDDLELLEVLRQTLTDRVTGLGAGVEVAFAESGDEALSILRAHQVDVLVTDQRMPDMTGIDLIGHARRLQPELHAILMSAVTERDGLLAAINEGRVDRYLVKPWQRGELLAAVRHALDAAAFRRERDALLARLERRLHTMSTLVELSTDASAPQSHRQLVERVHHALSRIVSFDVAAVLLVPPGPSGRAVLLLGVGRDGLGADSLAAAQAACLARFASTGATLDVDTMLVQVIGAGLIVDAPLPAPTALVALVGAAQAGPPSGLLYVASYAQGAYGVDDQQNLEALAASTAELSRRLAARHEDERRRMELMVFSMADGVIMTDQAGEIFLINPAARRMLSLPLAEEAPITARFLRERLGFYPFELVRAGRDVSGPLREEVRIGDQFLHSIVSPVAGSDGALVGVVVVLRDITEQKALELRKEEFVSIVSHELRTPLTSIGGALELLAEQYGEGLSDKQRRYLQMARTSSQKLNHIVDDLLDVAKAERGRMPLRTGEVDLATLCAQAAERFAGAIERRHIAIEVRSTGPVRLTADGDRVTQVLSNLLSNAVKFAPEGGRIELESFGSSATAELVGLTVWNSGPSIAEVDRERVFDKFEQVQSSSTRLIGGTGLGLAISRGFIERHGGHIWVEPSATGTRFVAVLPIVAHEPACLDDSTVLARKRILVVDPDLHAAWLLKGALLGARHHVDVAAEPAHALRLARARRPDLVTIDAQSPAGTQLAEILRHDPETRKVPLVIVSEHPSTTADIALRKPVTVAHLRETVLSLIADAGQLRRRILVVDDDAAIRTICRDVLEAHGFLVREAEDGAAALTEARRFRPDLVLLDVMMPNMDGFSLAQRLRAERETALTPMIFVSARGQTADKVKAFKLGAEDYLVKPFDSAELVARVDKALLRRDSDLGASPTTRLPGSQVIQQEIDRRLRDRGRFAFCYLDLDNLKAFNDYYGWAKADAVILQTGDILREAVARHGVATDFIGHIAGDDFVLITEHDCVDSMCIAIAETFDRLVPLYYNESDRLRGFIEARDRFGELRRFPIMSISIACVSEGVQGPAGLSSSAAVLKQQAKAIPGSSYVRDGEVRYPARDQPR
ncbi:MAG: response regulator [Polyangia bacterium]